MVEVVRWRVELGSVRMGGGGGGVGDRLNGEVGVAGKEGYEHLTGATIIQSWRPANPCSFASHIPERETWGRGCVFEEKRGKDCRFDITLLLGKYNRFLNSGPQQAPAARPKDQTWISLEIKAFKNAYHEAGASAPRQ